MRATLEGTRRFAARHVAGGRAVAEHFREAAGLVHSSIGAGTYLGKEDEATDAGYRAAIATALRRGANVVDLALSYRCQRSERAAGRAIAELIASKEVARDEIIVATKGGYIPWDGVPPADPEREIRETLIRPGILKPEDLVGGRHAIAPEFLKDGIRRSLRNTRLATLDVFFLHNPEAQLAEIPRGAFLSRIRSAFETLEAETAAGRIARYGVATWHGFRCAPTDETYLSLAELVEAARDVAGADHHFQVLQLPMNLMMLEALTLANQLGGAPEPGAGPEPEPVTLLEAAERFGLTVWASASLFQARLARRGPAELADAMPNLRTPAQRALQFARSVPGIGVALVGMARESHAAENLELAGFPPIPTDQFLATFFGTA